MSDLLASTFQSKTAWDRIEETAAGTRRDRQTVTNTVALADGAGAGQANRVFRDTRTVAAGGVDTLNLSTLTQQMFTTTVPMSFTTVRGVTVANLSTAAGAAINVGADGDNPFTAYAQRVGRQGHFSIANPDGWSVSGANVLRIANPGAAAVTYQITIVGA